MHGIQLPPGPLVAVMFLMQGAELQVLVLGSPPWGAPACACQAGGSFCLAGVLSTVLGGSASMSSTWLLQDPRRSFDQAGFIEP